ncbi:hypothetical protein AVEN_12057-1 [Araneus ventricosus]|uniref:DNA-directed DNA polymerase n=1 Tax=Araneus ventricosus TaxID=182803 RepID=A0A4Y2THH4_ARAVE|nr:hypothetical protein AVEN_263096-1 [Araneus ventricosus]GBN99213.1 hypothetical protein AVEN_12057-1 [Araneus ventricosus]
MSLSKIPGCFEFSELKKSFFPHLFNSKENQSYAGPFPDPKYFNPDDMSAAARAAFLEWQKGQEGKVFNFQDEMLSYCRYVNKYCRYPVGHPKIITDQFGDLNDHFGIIKCKILPPRGLYLPVLPLRSNGKLMFPLCRICSEELIQSPCRHGDDERSFIGTWVTEEVKLAIQKGYQMLKMPQPPRKKKCLRIKQQQDRESVQRRREAESPEERESRQRENREREQRRREAESTPERETRQKEKQDRKRTEKEK